MMAEMVSHRYLSRMHRQNAQRKQSRSAMARPNLYLKKSKARQVVMMNTTSLPTWQDLVWMLHLQELQRQVPKVKAGEWLERAACGLLPKSMPETPAGSRSTVETTTTQRVSGASTLE